jgi:glutamate synthase (NADPH) large chain
VRRILERIVREEGFSILGWRDMPVYASATGRVARASQPYMQQIFIGCRPGLDEDAFERKLYVVRKLAENEMRTSEVEDAGMFYIPSLSCRTVVYKGLLLASQLTNFYRELSDPDVVSALCLVHQRFSTNTFPSWQRAHPYRYIAHNGEINTLRGNVNWMHARQSLLASPLLATISRNFFPSSSPRAATPPTSTTRWSFCCRPGAACRTPSPC